MILVSLFNYSIHAFNIRAFKPCISCIVYDLSTLKVEKEI